MSAGWKQAKARNIKIGDSIILPNNGPMRTVVYVGNRHGIEVEIVVWEPAGVDGADGKNRTLKYRTDNLITRRKP